MQLSPSYRGGGVDVTNIKFSEYANKILELLDSNNSLLNPLFVQIATYNIPEEGTTSHEIIYGYSEWDIISKLLPLWFEYSNMERTEYSKSGLDPNILVPNSDNYASFSPIAIDEINFSGLNLYTGTCTPDPDDGTPYPEGDCYSGMMFDYTFRQQAVPEFLLNTTLYDSDNNEYIIDPDITVREFLELNPGATVLYLERGYEEEFCELCGSEKIDGECQNVACENSPYYTPDEE